MTRTMKAVDIVNQMREFKVEETMNILKCLYGARELQDLAKEIQGFIKEYESEAQHCSVGFKFDYWAERISDPVLESEQK